MIYVFGIQGIFCLDEHFFQQYKYVDLIQWLIQRFTKCHRNKK